MQEREHTRFSPSRSEQFFACPGAVNLLARVPALPSDGYSIEGNKAHHVLEVGLKNGIYDARQAFAISDIKNEEFDKEFFNAINTAFDYINTLLDDLYLSHGELYTFYETRVNPPCESAPGEAAGYLDVAIVCPDARKAWVIDYKHGVGISKSPRNNTQLLQYAAGLLYDENSPAKAFVSVIDAVTLVIIQPRSFHMDGEIREHTVSVLEVSDYLMELDERIAACLPHDAPLVPDVRKQCRMCEARDSCPALEAAAAGAIQPNALTLREVKTNIVDQVASMDIDRLAYIKSMRPTINAMLDAVDKRVAYLMHNHINVPGYKLVQEKPKRKWHEEEQVRAEKLSALIGVPIDELYEVSFRSITEIEKMVVAAFKSRVGRKQRRQAAQDAKQLFAYYTTKQSSGDLVVVSEEDPRPGVDKVSRNIASVNMIPPPTIK